MSAILVVRPSSLGDVVHALSLCSDVIAARPGVAIDWVAERAFADLPALCPHVRRVVPLDLRRWRTAPLARQTWREAGAFRRELASERYDAILDLQEQVKGAVIARCARGVRHGFDRASIREPVASWLDDVHHRVPRELHFAMRCRSLAAAALGYALDGPPRWAWTLPARVDGSPEGRYALALHATSRDDKLWPEERWRAILVSLADAGVAAVLPWGSEAERERSIRLAAGIPRSIVLPRRSLRELASLLSCAALAIGVDTGLTHLAAALGTPTVALFRTTDPRGAGVAIAGPHAEDLGGRGVAPTLDEVREAMRRRLRGSAGS